MSSGLQEPRGGLPVSSGVLSCCPPSPPACVFINGWFFFLCFQSGCSNRLLLFSCHGSLGVCALAAALCVLGELGFSGCPRLDVSGGVWL